MKHITIIEFTRNPDDQHIVVTVNGSIPNVVVGQTFVYDHPHSSKVMLNPKVTNIQHAVDPEGNLITYIDVYG